VFHINYLIAFSQKRRHGIGLKLDAMAQEAEDLGGWLGQNGGLVYSDDAFSATSTPRRRQDGPRQQQQEPDDLPRVAEQSRSLYLDFLQRQILEEGQRQNLGQAG